MDNLILSRFLYTACTLTAIGCSAYTHVLLHICLLLYSPAAPRFRDPLSSACVQMRACVRVCAGACAGVHVRACVLVCVFVLFCFISRTQMRANGCETKRACPRCDYLSTGRTIVICYHIFSICLQDGK